MCYGICCEEEKHLVVLVEELLVTFRRFAVGLIGYSMLGLLARLLVTLACQLGVMCRSIFS